MPTMVASPGPIGHPHPVTLWTTADPSHLAGCAAICSHQVTGNHGTDRLPGHRRNPDGLLEADQLVVEVGRAAAAGAGRCAGSR